MAIIVNPDISITSIFSRVSQMDIYRRYLGDVSLKRMISSPLRSGDSDPSFRLYTGSNGDIRFVDYGTGMRGGVIDLVSLLHPMLDLKGVLLRIWDDMGCEYIPSSIVRTRKVTDTPQFPEILVRKRRPDMQDIMLWERWGIDPSTLEHFRVSPISKFWIGGSAYVCRTLTYAYDLSTEWKIYRPFEKVMRFVSGGMTLQGYDLLPSSGELCVIQKSYKDVMFMHTMGIPSFAPQAESIDVPSHTMRELSQRFSRIVIWGDPDEAGMLFSKRHVDAFGIESVMNNDGTKDITDSCSEYGREHAVSMARHVLNI
jgi:hypothetical protein